MSFPSPNLEYSVFYGPKFASNINDLKTNVFSEWHNSWSTHFKEMDSTSRLFSDDLTRSTYLTVIHQGSAPVAMHLYSVWNLESLVHQNSRYLAQYTAEALQKFAALKLAKVLSMEYFYVNPQWRFQKSRLPLSEVLVGLGMNFFLQDPTIDGVITLARQAVKSDKRGGSWGLIPQCQVTLHNNECSAWPAPVKPIAAMKT